MPTVVTSWAISFPRQTYRACHRCHLCSECLLICTVPIPRPKSRTLVSESPRSVRFLISKTRTFLVDPYRIISQNTYFKMFFSFLLSSLYLTRRLMTESMFEFSSYSPWPTATSSTFFNLLSSPVKVMRASCVFCKI